MQSIELIQKNLETSQQIVLARIEDMRPHALVTPMPGRGCHTLWILGHLACVEYLVIDSFMRHRPSPLDHWLALFEGEEISKDASDYPDFDIVLEECKTARGATADLLNSLSEDDLDRGSLNPPDIEDQLFGTWRSCFQYVADHWLMHRGQLANARSAAGVRRMWY